MNHIQGCIGSTSICEYGIITILIIITFTYVKFIIILSFFNLLNKLSYSISTTTIHQIMKYIIFVYFRIIHSPSKIRIFCTITINIIISSIFNNRFGILVILWIVLPRWCISLFTITLIIVFIVIFIGSPLLSPKLSDYSLMLIIRTYSMKKCHLPFFYFGCRLY